MQPTMANRIRYGNCWALLIRDMNCVGAFRETPLQMELMPTNHTRIQQHQLLSISSRNCLGVL